MTSTDQSGAPALADPQASIDMAEVESFAGRLVGTYVGSITAAMIAIGHNTGLWDAAASGAPATSADLAARADLDERYVREWLGAMVTAGIFTYDPESKEYRLPIEHAVVLSGPTSMNMGPLAAMVSYLNRFVDDVGTKFRSGGGVPYDAYRPEFTTLMDDINRRVYDEALVSAYVPMAQGLAERLAGGARVADFGTGAGHPLNILAAEFPASSFVGYDIASDALTTARAEAVANGLENVEFVQRDVATLDEVGSYDAVFAFDAIHDQADPAGVLANIRRALKDDGYFLMVDIKASSHVEDNCNNPIAPLIYGISVLHCMTVSLAYGGAGLGTAWGEQVACSMLRDAGFGHVEVHEIPQDPFNLVYVCRP